MRAHGVSTRDEALLWILDPRTSWPDGALEETPKATAGARVDVKGLEEGTYAIEWWDPAGGKPGARSEAVASGGSLRLAVPEFRVDIACRVRRMTR